MIAALYVDPKGCYAGLSGVEPWGLPYRDAREYAGPWPVVAHPPCTRWCRLAGLVEARWSDLEWPEPPPYLDEAFRPEPRTYTRGEDGGCFAAALAAVRTFRGVLEHPAWSDAWAAFGLPRPHRGGGWTQGECGGWACHIEQWRYGHRAKKATWLYAYGTELPTLRWGHVPDSTAGPLPALVSWCGNHVASGEDRPRLSKREASATPPEFRDVLIAIARSVPLR